MERCVVVGNLKVQTLANHPFEQRAFYNAIHFAQAFAAQATSGWQIYPFSLYKSEQAVDIAQFVQADTINSRCLYDISTMEAKRKGETIGLLNFASTMPIFDQIAYADLVFFSASSLFALTEVCFQQWFTVLTRLKIIGGQCCFYMDYDNVDPIDKARLLDMLQQIEPLLDYAIYPADSYIQLHEEPIENAVKYMRLMGIQEVLVPLNTQEMMLIHSAKTERLTLHAHEVTAQWAQYFGSYMANRSFALI